MTEKYSLVRRYLITVAICVVTALALMPLHEVLELSNVVLVFLLVVFLISVNLGREPAVLSSVLSVVLFDYFFVSPRFSLAVNNPQFLVVFGVMLVVALITTHMAAGLKKAAVDARAREQKTNALYGIAKSLAGALSSEHAYELAAEFVRSQTGADLWVLASGDATLITEAQVKDAPFVIESHIATVALTENRTIRSASFGNTGWASVYVPLSSSMRTRGVMAVATHDNAPVDISLLEAIASLLAITLERLHYVQVAHDRQLEAHTERLRSSILSALSHDLRTPLTVFVGVADSLTRLKPEPSAQVLDAARTIHTQALRLSSLVGNLLELARLSTGQIHLKCEWHHLQDVISASLDYLGPALIDHKVNVSIPENLPLIEIDAVLIERVLSNLLENASKYSPDKSEIDLVVIEHPEHIEVSIRDRGEGFHLDAVDQIFDMFVRGHKAAGVDGYGIGLTISKVIVEAHGGKIALTNHPEGGGWVHVHLNKGTPPTVEDEV